MFCVSYAEAQAFARQIVAPGQSTVHEWSIEGAPEENPTASGGT